MGLVGSPLGGVLADRIGRRPTLLVSYAATGIALILYGSLSSLLALAVFTPLFGITSDLQSPAASAAVADLVEPDLRNEAYGLRRQAGNAAFALGPPLGALVVYTAGTRWIFVLAGIAWLIAFAVVWARVPETRPSRAERQERGSFWHALRDRKLLLLALGGGLSVVVYAQFDSVLGVFLHRERGMALATWGLLFGINPVLTALVQYPVARRAARISPRAVLATGIVVQGAAMFVLWPVHGLAIVAVSVVGMTIGEMLLAPTTTALGAALAPRHLRGSYQGVRDLSFAAFWAPGTAVGLAVVGHGHGDWMLAGALPVALLGALAFWPLPRAPVAVDLVVPAPSEAAAAS